MDLEKSLCSLQSLWESCHGQLGRVLSTLCFCFPQKLSKDVQNALAKANNTAEETISAMKTVRSFANEEAEANVYWQKLQQVYRLNKREALAYTYYVWSSGVGGLHQGLAGDMASGVKRCTESCVCWAQGALWDEPSLDVCCPLSKIYSILP